MYKVLVMAEQSKLSWTDHFFHVGLHYYAGIVESSEELMESHKLQLIISCYSCMTILPLLKMQCFKNTW